MVLQIYIFLLQLSWSFLKSYLITFSEFCDDGSLFMSSLQMFTFIWWRGLVLQQFTLWFHFHYNFLWETFFFKIFIISKGASKILSVTIFIMQFFAGEWHHWWNTKRVRKPDKLGQVGFGKQQVNWWNTIFPRWS